MAVPFMVAQYGSSARIAVEIAFGADLSDTFGAGWTWLDVTSDVRTDDKVTFSMGRNDEASTSQPADCSFKLDNASSAYSLSGLSANYPNVRRNTPVRVRVDPADGSGYRVLFQGYANGFTPSWDASLAGRIPVATVSASGIMRRLGQGPDPLRSSLFRYHTKKVTPQDYWPLEEDKTATAGQSSTGGRPAAYLPINSGGILYGKIAWGADTDYPATSRAVQVAGGASILAPVQTALYPSFIAVAWSMRYTSHSGARMTVSLPGSDGLKVIMPCYTDGSFELWEASTTGTPTLGGTVARDPSTWDNQWQDFILTIDQPNGIWYLNCNGVMVLSVASSKRGRAASIQIDSSPNPGGVEDPVSIAHIAAFNANFAGVPTGGTVSYRAAVAAYAGETPGARMARLCSEELLPLTTVGTPQGQMGVQRPLALLDLLRECETVDQGVLFDGVGAGLRYESRDQRENGSVDLTVPCTSLVAPFEPVDDDQRNRNRVVASSVDGIKAQYDDVTGPLGTAAIGIYDSSLEVNTFNPSSVLDYAAWQVNQGTVQGYRVPTLALDMAPAHALAGAVLAVEPSSRVAVTGMGTMAAFPSEDLALLVEGVTHELSTFEWTFTAKCSPFSPWLIAIVSADTGDTHIELLRPDTDGAVVSTAAAIGATSLVVATASGPLWTTVADDFPLFLSVGGMRVRATACTGAASPQTFTVDALTVARAVNSPVSVWAPAGLGL